MRSKAYPELGTAHQQLVYTFSYDFPYDFEICNKYKYGGLIRPEFEVDVNNMIILKLGDPDSCHIQMNGW